jgi:hypothetical protein
MSAANLKLEVGKSYRTRDGRKVKIVSYDLGVPLCYAGVFDDRVLEYFRNDGSNDRLSGIDLVAEWKESVDSSIQSKEILGLATGTLPWQFKLTRREMIAAVLYAADKICYRLIPAEYQGDPPLFKDAIDEAEAFIAALDKKEETK